MALKKIINVSGVAVVEHDGMRLLTGQTVTVQKEIYIRVSHVAGGKNQQTATVTSIEVGGSTVREDLVTFDPDLDGPNFIKQAYEHLKTLPEFAGAEDC